MNKAIYSISWIPAQLVQDQLKTRWEFVGEKETPIPEVAIGFQFNQEILNNISWLILPSAGIDHLPLEMLRKKGVKVINSHANSTAVAEHGFALLMDCYKRISFYDRRIRAEGKWSSSSHLFAPNTNLKGKKLGIFGYGSIGKKIAEYARTFGMKPVIFRKHASNGEYTLSQYNEVATDLDAVVITLPLTSSTLGFFNKERLELLKDNIKLVNIGRGKVISTKDMISLLKKRPNMVVGLDVWDENPLRSANKKIPVELLELENLIISPYRAWINSDSYSSIAAHIAKVLDNIANGTNQPYLDLENWI